VSHIHWVARGTGTPKDRDEVNRRDVCECDVMGEYFLSDRRTEAVIYYVYYESIKREPKIRGKYECRCDERLQTKSKEFTRLAYTGLVLQVSCTVRKKKL
jgi:hypothetical protein